MGTGVSVPRASRNMQHSRIARHPFVGPVLEMPTPEELENMPDPSIIRVVRPGNLPSFKVGFEPNETVADLRQAVHEFTKTPKEFISLRMGPFPLVEDDDLLMPTVKFCLMK